MKGSVLGRRRCGSNPAKTDFDPAPKRTKLESGSHNNNNNHNSNSIAKNGKHNHCRGNGMAPSRPRRSGKTSRSNAANDGANKTQNESKKKEDDNGNIGSNANGEDIQRYETSIISSHFSMSNDLSLTNDENKNEDLCEIGHSVYETGGVKKTYLGVYLKGSRKDELCIVKKFKNQRSFNENDYLRELKGYVEAIKFVESWFKYINKNQNKNQNKKDSINSKYKLIRVAYPVITQMITEDDNDGNDNDSNQNRRITRQTNRVVKDELVLVEPFLQGDFIKFNNNDGDVGTQYKNHFLQAFSHFTYHESKGRMVYSDVQGVEKDDMVALTDPCILSNDKGKYGNTDGGRFFLINFMIKHECNEYCDRDWIKPGNRDRQWWQRMKNSKRQ